MKRSDLKAGISALSKMVPFDAHESPLDFAERAAEWALEQVRGELERFVAQVKETNGYYTFELDDLPKICDVEDDK